ncbi:MAG: S-layer homology domain-containing protein [Acidimicrobiia bacterium]|nr:S-layer homology domain-containing protein [Acidimicrobiia bacterium]
MPFVRPTLAVLTSLLLVASLAGTAAAVGPAPMYNAPAPGDGELVSETMRIGPISLAAQGHSGWDRNMVGAVPMPTGTGGEDWIAIRGIEFDLVDDQGTSLGNDDVHFHHIAFFTPGATDPACPSRGFGHLHLASGAERTPVALPDPYAMRKPNAQSWLGNWHVMNLADEARDIYIEYEVVHQPGRTDDTTRWVEPWFLDVSGHCGNAEYDVPGDGGPDSVHVQSKTWTMPEAGIIVGTGGHLHDGGIATELRTADDDLICRSEVVYADDHHDHDGHSARSGGHHHGTTIERINPCAVHWQFEAGEELTLDSIYHNHQPEPGAMGINVTFIWWGDQHDDAEVFPDVPETHEFARHIGWAASTGVTTGYDDGTFRPTTQVSRQALVAFLYRAFAGDDGHDEHDEHDHHGHSSRHGDHNGHDHGGFSDVPADHPFADAITWAADGGLVKGYPDGTFRPDIPVSRQALVAFLHRLAGSPEPHDDHDHSGHDDHDGHHGHSSRHGDHNGHDHGGFSDVPADHPFADAITWAADGGLVEGYHDGTFRPLEPVSRQAAAAVLYRYEADRYAAELWQLYRDLFDWE